MVKSPRQSEQLLYTKSQQINFLAVPEKPSTLTLAFHSFFRLFLALHLCGDRGMRVHTFTRFSQLQATKNRPRHMSRSSEHQPRVNSCNGSNQHQHCNDNSYGDCDNLWTCYFVVDTYACTNIRNYCCTVATPQQLSS